MNVLSNLRQQLLNNQYNNNQSNYNNNFNTVENTTDNNTKSAISDLLSIGKNLNDAGIYSNKNTDTNITKLSEYLLPKNNKFDLIRNRMNQNRMNQQNIFNANKDTSINRLSNLYNNQDTMNRMNKNLDFFNSIQQQSQERRGNLMNTIFSNNNNSTISNFTNLLNNKSNSNINANKSSMIQQGLKFQGTPYVWGGNNLAKGVDCSGLTQQLYKTQGVSIPRTAQEQYNKSTKISSNDMQVGDLIFFDTLKNNKQVDHVGIYMGNGQMLHASSGKKQVTTTNLNDKYWKSTYVGVGRY